MDEKNSKNKEKFQRDRMRYRVKEVEKESVRIAKEQKRETKGES